MGLGLLNVSMVANSEVGRSYVGGEGPDPADRDSIIQTELQNNTNEWDHSTHVKCVTVYCVVLWDHSICVNMLKYIV